MQTFEPILNSRLRRPIAVGMRLVAVVVLIGMFIGTHIPSVGPKLFVSHVDKIFHFGAYLTLTLCLLASWELSRGYLRASHYFVVWLFGTLYGIFDEVTQIPVGRTCDGYDWLADILGIIVGLIVYQGCSAIVTRILLWRQNLALPAT